ncbi:MAG: PorT family protein [Bacteroidales bacterium]|nr:PorT family protein [Bacteroidales bacterium]
MSNKSDWTDRLPELLEGYTEAEPEGLWDAVQAGIEPKKRRIAAAWWYSGGALLAAAAIVAVVLLWPVRPSTDVSLVPGDVVAEVTEGDDDEAPADGEVLPSYACLSETPPRKAGPLPLQPREARAPEGSTSPSSTATTDTDLQIDSALPAEEGTAVLPEEEGTSTESTDATTDGNVQKEPEMHIEDETHVTPETHVVPIERIKPKVRRKPTTRLQAGLTATGYFSQLASTSSTGVGIPLNPGSRLSMMQTKASGGPGTGYAAPSSMLSRNKASTTDANHYQSAKLALTLKLNLDYRWGIETGVVSSTLRSEFNTTAGSSRTVSGRNIAYLGIPLFVNYNVFEWKRFSMYLNAGPMYEFTTRTSLETRSYVGSSLTDSNFDYTLYKDSKWSLNASAGLQLRIFDHGALFVQPGVSYHFKDDSALETFYTEHPSSYNVTFGYRILFL